MNLSLRTNILWTLLGNVVYAACQWGELSLLARLGSPQVVGQFSLGLAVTAPVVMFGNLQLREVQATDAAREYTFVDYLTVRLTTGLLALSVIICIVLLAGYSLHTGIVILLVGVSKVVESISDIFLGLFQQNERMDLVARSLLIKGPLSLLALGLGTVLGHDIVWGVIGLAVAWLGVLFLHDVAVANRLFRSTRNAHIADRRAADRTRAALKLAMTAFPLGLVAGLNSLNTNIPRYVLERHAGEYSLGIYSALAYVTVAGSTVVRALGQSASPRLARMLMHGRRWDFLSLVRRLVVVLMFVGFGGVAVAYVAGPEILSILYGREYADHTQLFLIVMAAGAIGYVADFMGYAMTAARRYYRQAVLFTVVSLTTLVTSVALVPTLGAIGAGLAKGVGSAVQAVGGWCVVTAARQSKDSE